MKQKFNFKINYVDVLYFMLLIPFFEPGCINDFIQLKINESLFSLIGNMFSLGRYLTAAIGMLLFYKGVIANRKSTSLLFRAFIINSLMMMVSNIFNGASVSAILSSFYDIGFLCIYEILSKKGFRHFIKVHLWLIGSLSIIGVLSVIVFPNGFNMTNNIVYAIYFLGSKNSAINIYIIFIIAFLGYEYAENGKLTIKGYIFLIPFSITGLIMQSSSTIFCLLLILAYYTLEVVSFEKFILKPWISFIVVISGILIIYIGASNFRVIANLVDMLGRDLSFSGRTTLWEQAIRYFKDSPIIGKGVDIFFYNYSGYVQNSAHSQYLDRLAKYGIIAFSTFLYSIVNIEVILNQAKEKHLASIMGLLFSVYLLRMGFDVVNFDYFICIAYLISEVTCFQKDKQKNGKSLIFIW